MNQLNWLGFLEMRVELEEKLSHKQEYNLLNQDGLVYRATNNWNNLPPDIRKIDLSSTFKMQLRDWIIKNMNVI